jgi:hypothetical protein
MNTRPWTVSLFALAASTALAADPEFIIPPRHAGPPLPEHAVTNRAFQGIPSIAVTDKGRLWATWYAGPTPGEDQNNYATLTTSGDNGKTWKEVLIADPDGSGPSRAFDPEVWMGPDGKLRWFWASRKTDAKPAVKSDILWMREATNPDSENPTWGPPVHVADGVMMCKPLVLSSGEWALPVCTWFSDNSSKIVVSKDNGRTWSVRGGANVPPAARTFDEHMFIERKDKSLWVLTRTKYGIGESVSTDHGVTWPELTPTTLAHPSARFFIRRLDSGNLLLVKHGALDKSTARSHLTAYISTDDGKSWHGGLLLDERNGVSYPDGQQDKSGLIRVIYDYSRTGDRQILIASFREEDAAAGKSVTPSVQFRQLVSQASGGQPKVAKTAKAASTVAVEKNSDGAPLQTAPRGALALADVKARPFATDEKLFPDRNYVLAERPEKLASVSFLPIAMDGEKKLRCSRAGVVYFLTPTPDRNHDSAEPALLKQGFKKAALPEVPLFNPSNPGNYTSLYQKVCAEGETITVGKWAVPVFFQ